jgi:hypothetical protein
VPEPDDLLDCSVVGSDSVRKSVRDGVVAAADFGLLTLLLPSAFWKSIAAKSKFASKISRKNEKRIRLWRRKLSI